MPKYITTFDDLPDEVIQFLVSRFGLKIATVRQVNRRLKRVLDAHWLKILKPHMLIPSRFFRPIVALSNNHQEWPKLYLKDLKSPAHYSYKGKRITYISKTHQGTRADQKHISPYYVVYLLEGSKQLHALRSRLPLELLNHPIDTLSQVKYSEPFSYTQSNDECAGFIPIAISGKTVFLFSNPDTYQHFNERIRIDCSGGSWSSKHDPSCIIKSFTLAAPIAQLCSPDQVILNNGNYVQICARELQTLKTGPIKQLVNAVFIQDNTLYSGTGIHSTKLYEDLPEDAVIIPLQLRTKQIHKPLQHNHRWAKKGKPTNNHQTFHLLYSKSTNTLLSITPKQNPPLKPVILKLRGKPLPISNLTLKHTDTPSGLSLYQPGWPTIGTIHTLEWKNTHEYIELHIYSCPDTTLEQQCRLLEYQNSQVLDMLALLRPASLDILPPKIIRYLTRFIPIQTLRLLSKSYKQALERLWIRKVCRYIYHPTSKPTTELIDSQDAWPECHYPSDYHTYTYKGRPITHIVGLKDITEYPMWSGTYIPKEVTAYLYIVDNKLYTYPDTTIPLNLADFPIDALFQSETNKSLGYGHRFQSYKLKIGIIISGEKVIHIGFKTKIEGANFRTGKVVLDHLYVMESDTLLSPLRQFVYGTHQLLLKDGSFGTYDPSHEKKMRPYETPVQTSNRCYMRSEVSHYVLATPYKEDQTFFRSPKGELWYHQHDRSHEVENDYRRYNPKTHAYQLYEYFLGHIYSLTTPLGLVTLFYGRFKNTNLQFFSPEGYYLPDKHYPHIQNLSIAFPNTPYTNTYDVELKIEDEYIDTSKIELRQRGLGDVSIFYSDRPKSPFKVGPDIKYLKANDEYDRCIEMSLIPDHEAKLVIETRELEYHSLQVSKYLLQLKNLAY